MPRPPGRAARPRSTPHPRALLPQGEKGDGGATPASFDAGRYTVKQFLGEGGKKKVYLAHDRLLDRDVAFALIKNEGLDQVGRDRITREAQAMGRLGAHPYIVSIFDLGEEPDLSPGLTPTRGEEAKGQPFIVTELMSGGDVEGLIERAPDHKLPLAQALRIAEQVCEALAYAHSQDIVHRDLKPGNVWLTGEVVGSRQSAVGDGVGTTIRDPRLTSPQPSPTRRGSDEVGVAKIGDFGLAIAIDRTRLTQAGMMVGTVSYNAARAGNRRRSDTTLGPLFPGRDALRDGRGPAAVHRR